MNLDRCMNLCAFIVLMLGIGSGYVSAVILSSETLNMESTASTTQENVLQTPDFDIISDEYSEFGKENERMNENSGETSKSDISEFELQNQAPKTETQLPQPNIIEIIYQESDVSRGKLRDDNVVQDVPSSTPIVVENIPKNILVEPPTVASIDNLIEDTKNNSSQVQNQTISSETTNEFTQPNEPSRDSDLSDDNKIESDDTPVEKELNLTEENQIPVFSEWAQKRLEEVEKEVEQETVNTSTMKKSMPTASKTPVLKLKNSKNYASPDCGAKIIAANSESSGTGYVLTSTRDEYMLSPCKSRVWFVVELCEAIQAERIDLANFELFSSSPKNFSVGVSSRFPTRDWSNVGKFIANDERYIQSFDLYPHLFGKYVRVDIHSHYNSEHFCPISLFRVYGTSEFEAFETENRQHPIEDMDDDDEDDQESDATKSKTNIFKSASDAVMSIVDSVKKAASFVKPHGNQTTDNSRNNLNLKSTDNCISPNHPISCENCSEDMMREVKTLVECKQSILNRLLSIDIIRNSLYKSQICNTFIGSDLNVNCSEPMDINVTTSKQLTDLQMDYINNLFSIKYITAMCNLLAASDRKFAFNSTIVESINVTISKVVVDELLPSDQIKPKPLVEMVQTDQSSSQESNTDTTEQQTNILTDSPEIIQDIEINEKQNEKQNERNEKEPVESTTASPTIETSEEITDKPGQNIFNVVDANEMTTESQGILVDIPVTESSILSSEQEILPPVILLPEATTQAPNTELNDASEEQASNGWTNTPQFGQKLHSESVFLRLSNRVKALERNMSLSGQYLEELSRRYKKQVEELQMSFAKTLVNIEEQSRKNSERKQELLEQNQKLRNDLEILTERIFSWRNLLICCLCFTCVQILIFHLILKIWGRRYGLQLERTHSAAISEADNSETLTRKRKSGNVPVKFRRKSAEEKRERNPSESSSTAIQRRPSSEALNIAGTYTELLIDDSNSTRNSSSNYDYHQVCRGEKITQINKSSSIENHEADISGYVKIEDLKELYDKPEDEYEFYGPAADLKGEGSRSQVHEYSSETTLDSSFDSVPLHPKRPKAIRNKNKNRRLSSPSFFRSPFSSGSAAQSTGWEWHRSKKLKNSSQLNNKKSKSESPPSLKQNGINNNNFTPTNVNNKKLDDQWTDPSRSSISSSIEDRKTSGSFKRILKKIF